MSLFILGGFAKNFSLKMPDGATRPTSHMLRRKLFDKYQNLEQYEFVDLCAGTGAMGLEAISRDAHRAIFVENNARSFKVLNQNIQKFIEKFKLDKSICKAIKKDFKQFDVKQVSVDKKTMVFFDPPYEQLELYEEFKQMLYSFPIGSIVIIEACEQKTMSKKDFELMFGAPFKFLSKASHYFALYEV